MRTKLMLFSLAASFITLVGCQKKLQKSDIAPPQEKTANFLSAPKIAPLKTEKTSSKSSPDSLYQLYLNLLSDRQELDSIFHEYVELRSFPYDAENPEALFKKNNKKADSLFVYKEGLADRYDKKHNTFSQKINQEIANYDRYGTFPSNLASLALQIESQNGNKNYSPTPEMAEKIIRQDLAKRGIEIKEKRIFFKPKAKDTTLIQEVDSANSKEVTDVEKTWVSTILSQLVHSH